jgi:hypothetical protein
MLQLKTCLLSLVLISASIFADSQVTETKDYSDIFPVIKDLSQKYGNEEVLVVFDVDDTLLVIEHCKKPDGTLTRGIGKLFSCPSEHTEDGLSHSLAEIQKKGIHTIGLTARGNSMVKATQRELARKHTGLKTLDFQGMPFTQSLTKIEVAKTKKCKRGETAPCLSGEVSDRPKFTKGVMYANGTHKGLALKALLKRLKASYKAIVFIDDRKKNTVNVNQVYVNQDKVEVEVFLYLRHRD